MIWALFYVTCRVGFFPFVPPVRFSPSVTENALLHSKLKCKNFALAFGGANYMHSLAGDTHGKDLNCLSSFWFLNANYFPEKHATFFWNKTGKNYKFIKFFGDFDSYYCQFFVRDVLP